MDGSELRAEPVDSRGELGSIWTGLVVVLALIAALCVLIVLAAGSRQGTVRRGWQQTLGTPEQVFAEYPAREANPAALELERLAARCEIDLVPRHRRVAGKASRRRVPPGHPDRNRDKLIGDWVGEALSGSALQIGEPPEPVVDYLDEHADALGAVRDLLIDVETIEWERELEALFQAPIPNLIGLIELNRVLVADALLHLRRDDESTALRDLTASWRIGVTLLDEPEEIVVLIGMSISRQVAGALRHVETVPSEWGARLAGIEPRRAAMRSMMLSAWVWSQTDGSGMTESQDGVLTRAFKSMIEPYARMSMADVSERMRIRLERLQELDPRCDADLEALGVGFELRIPRWNIARHAYGPGMFEGVIDRANRLELDAELASRLIEIRAARRANGGRWPAALPGSAASRACPEDRWSYEIEPDGSLRFGLDRTPDWRNLPPSNRGVLPTSVVVR